MTIVFTDQSLERLETALSFMHENLNVSLDKILEINKEVFNSLEHLTEQPHLGQIEPFLEHLNIGHRRIIYKHFKVIYRIEGETIYVTDIFDTRQSPSKLLG